MATTVEGRASPLPPAAGPRLTLTLEKDRGIHLDSAPSTIGLAIEGGAVEELIASGTPLPTSVVREVTTSSDFQRALALRIVEGARPAADDNRHIGTLVLLDLPPAPAGVPKVRLALTLTSDYQLQVAASDLLRRRPVQLQVRQSIADISAVTPSDPATARADAAALEGQRIRAALSTLGAQVAANEGRLRTIHGAAPIEQLHLHLARTQEALSRARNLPAELQRAAEELDLAQGLAAALAEDALRHPLVSTLDSRAHARTMGKQQ